MHECGHWEDQERHDILDKGMHDDGEDISFTGPMYLTKLAVFFQLTAPLLHTDVFLHVVQSVLDV